MIEQHEPPLNIIDKHMSSVLASYYFSTSRSRDVILVRQIPATGHNLKDGIVLTTIETYPCSHVKRDAYEEKYMQTYSWGERIY